MMEFSKLKQEESFLNILTELKNVVCLVSITILRDIIIHSIRLQYRDTTRMDGWVPI